MAIVSKSIEVKSNGRGVRIWRLFGFPILSIEV